MPVGGERGGDGWAYGNAGADVHGGRCDVGSLVFGRLLKHKLVDGKCLRVRWVVY